MCWIVNMDFQVDCVDIMIVLVEVAVVDGNACYGHISSVRRMWTMWWMICKVNWYGQGSLLREELTQVSILAQVTHSLNSYSITIKGMQG